jgi:lipoyl(octanoyl) transferase
MPLQPWYLLRSGPTEPAFNMALDEALLQAGPRLGRPVLRFYGWTEPAATFGYFQHYADIARATPLRPLLRRPTGGGLVPHDADWTYSLVFPPGHEWYALPATESYRRVHEWIRSAFSVLAVSTQLAPQSAGRDAAPSAPDALMESDGSGTASYQPHLGQCFQGHEKSDLLYRSQKVAGAAQRRTRHGLLIQGSVQPQHLGLSRAAWEQAMCDVAAAEQHAQWEPLTPDSALTEQARALTRQKYSQTAYNQKR